MRDIATVKVTLRTARRDRDAYLRWADDAKKQRDRAAVKEYRTKAARQERLIRKLERELASIAKNPRAHSKPGPESGRFKRCVSAVEKKGSARDAAAVCAAAGRKKYGAKAMAKWAAGARAKKKRNPEAEAAALYEAFHGRPSSGFTDYELVQHYHSHLAQLGRLVWLKVRLENETAKLIRWDRVKVCCSEDGGQLYFVGGDQSIDLAALGLADALPKDQVVIGSCFEINYHTTKHFHDFQPMDYVHTFGEEGGSFPILCYDVRSELIYVAGGSYHVKPEGIVN